MKEVCSMVKRKILKDLRKGGYLYVFQKGSLCGIGKWKVYLYFYEDLCSPVVAVFTVVGRKFYFSISPSESPIYGCDCVARPTVSKIVGVIEKRIEEMFE